MDRAEIGGDDSCECDAGASSSWSFRRRSHAGPPHARTAIRSALDHRGVAPRWRKPDPSRRGAGIAPAHAGSQAEKPRHRPEGLPRRGRGRRRPPVGLKTPEGGAIVAATPLEGWCASMPRKRSAFEKSTLRLGSEQANAIRPSSEGGAATVSLLVYHRDGVTVAPLHDGRPLTLGREPPADVVIDDRSLSRQHARFDLADGELTVHDLGSTNGTQVNGKRADHAILRPGDTVTVGSILVSPHLRAALAPAPHGLGSHDDFRSWLDREVTVARHFGDELALVMASMVDGEQVLHWFGGVEQNLRPVDRVAVYSASIVELLMPRMNVEAAVGWIRAAPTGGRALRHRCVTSVRAQRRRASRCLPHRAGSNRCRTMRRRRPGGRVAAATFRRGGCRGTGGGGRGDAACVRAGRARRRLAHLGVVGGGDRLGEGDRRASNPRWGTTARRADDLRQLRRHSAPIGGEHAVRPRAGRVHRRYRAPPGVLRARRTAARCCSTKSASCRLTRRPRCCASCENKQFDPRGSSRPGDRGRRARHRRDASRPAKRRVAERHLSRRPATTG